jgi:hypothetical protein
LFVALSAFSEIDTSPLYIDIHPSFDIDFETMFDDVFFHI